LTFLRPHSKGFPRKNIQQLNLDDEASVADRWCDRAAGSADDLVRSTDEDLPWVQIAPRIFRSIKLVIRQKRTNVPIGDIGALTPKDVESATDSHSQKASNLRRGQISGVLVDNLESVLVVLIGQKLGSFY
jgi:hypothetical protein